MSLAKSRTSMTSSSKIVDGGPTSSVEEFDVGIVDAKIRKSFRPPTISIERTRRVFPYSSCRGAPSDSESRLTASYLVLVDNIFPIKQEDVLFLGVFQQHFYLHFPIDSIHSVIVKLILKINIYFTFDGPSPYYTIAVLVSLIYI